MYVYVKVVGQGNVQLHQASFEVKKELVSSLNVSLPVTQASVPRMKVLGVVARDDGELVADVIDVEVACQLEHQVRYTLYHSVCLHAVCRMKSTQKL